KLDDPVDKSKPKEIEVVAEQFASVEVDEYKNKKEEINEHDDLEKDDADEGGDEEEKEAKKRKITNQPLVGIVRRGKKPKEDIMLEKILLNGEKQCAEHKLLVDLGRSHVGKISKPCYIQVEKLMNIDRYSHVMHISSIATV
ncbi:anthranilate synthase component i-2 chloroplastic-like, partial [Trifolium pratense]